MTPHRAFWIATAIISFCAGPLSADDWPQWRGPARNGISAETGWSAEWPAEGPKVLWKAEVGLGFSSFSVAKGRVYTIGHANETDTVFCLDADKGHVIWYHAYPSEIGDKFYEGGPSSTPTVDGDHVYTIGKWGDLFCFDAARGRIVWSKNIAKESAAAIPAWGFGGSPLILGDVLYLNIGESGIALEKATGKILWKSEEGECGYTTPLPFPGNEGLLLFSSGKAFIAADAKTGKESWRVKWMPQYGVNAADPVLHDGRMLISAGYGKGAALVRFGKSEPEILWQHRLLRLQMNPAVFLSGSVYGVDGNDKEKTALKCLDFESGVQKWAYPLNNGGSVTAADGRLIVLGGDGELMVGPASPEGFKPSARAKVLEGKCWTVPVLANGRIVCRNAAGQVVCVDVRKP